MNRHAKASSAGSTEGNRKRRGSLLCVLALATLAFALSASPALAITPTAGPVSISAVTETSAHVEATVSTSEDTYWRFDYSSDGGQTWEESAPNAHNGPIPATEASPVMETVSGDFEGLQPNTKYLVRFAILPLSLGQLLFSPTPNPSFTTTATPGVEAPKVLEIANASSVSIISAKASGKVERPAGAAPVLDTRCHFEYVADAQFTIDGFQSGTPVPCEPKNPITTPGPTAVTAKLINLKPASTYHLRLVASNSGATDLKVAANTFTTKSATAPTLALEPASVSFLKAHLKATINPEGGNVDDLQGPQPIPWELQLNREGAGWVFAAGGVMTAESPPSGGTTTALRTDPIQVFNKDITGLTANTKYEFRLKALYTGLETITAPQEFTTLAVEPPSVVSIDDAANVEYTVAKATGKVKRPANADPAFDANCRFEYVSDAQFAENEANSQPLFSGAGAVGCEPASAGKTPGESPVAAKLTGLTPGTAYHLRLVAANAGGSDAKVAADTFTTLTPVPAPIVLASAEATAISYTSAKASGEIERPGTGADPALDTSCRFEYVTDAQFDASEYAEATPVDCGIAPLTSPGAKKQVEAKLTGLLAATEYHLRLTAANAGGDKSLEVSDTFTTLPVEAPSVVSIDDAANVEYTVAKATGKVKRPANADPAFDANCRFEYVSDAQFAENEANSQPLFSGAGAVGCEPASAATTPGESPVAAKLSSLAPSTTYHLRLVAANAGGSDAKVAANTFTTQGPLPTLTVSIDPVTVHTDTTTTFVGHINPGGADPALQVIWEFQCTPACPGQLSGQISSPDNSSQEVKVNVSGLEPIADYEVKLVAFNFGGGSAEAGPEAFKTDAVGPGVETVPAFALGNGTEAQIAGKVTSKKQASQYWFEYGLGPAGTATYEHSVPVTKDGTVPFQVTGSGDLETGSETVSNVLAASGTFKVGQRIAGAGIPANTTIAAVDTDAGRITLSQGATASATGVALTALITDTQLFTQSISGLSPGETYHFRIVAKNASGESKGEDLAFETASPLPFPANCSNLKLRAETNSAALPECRAYEMSSDPDKAGGDASAAPSSSPDGNRVGYISPAGFADSPASNNVSSYLAERTPVGWKTRSMTPPVAANNFALAGVYTLADFNTDLTKAVSIARSGAIETGNYNLSQNIFLTSDDGSTQWVTKPGLSDGLIFDKLYGGRSADSSHIVFKSPQAFTADPTGGSGEVWEWVNGSVRLVSVLPDGSPVGALGAAVGSGGPAEGDVLGSGFTGTLREPTAVSADGSRIFFSVDSYHLYVREDGERTEDVSLSQRTGREGQGSRISLSFAGANATASRVYYNTGDQMTDDAPPGGGAYAYNLETKKLKFVAADAQIVSIDGDRTYFVAPGQLVPGKGVAGARNLYLEEGEDVTFIATLGGDALAGAGKEGATPQATPDGRFLSFESAQRLTAFDNAGHAEVYLYDAIKDSLRCVSCNPDGHTPTGDASLSAEGELTPNFKTHGISDDGSHVFFQTTDALVPADVNGRKDVYEYRDGNVALISTGTSNYPSVFWTASPDGKNVFFGTRDALVGQDIDGGASDIYDARVNGGFPAPVPPNPCEGENCQGKAAAPPAFVGPATASGNGKGNAHGRKHSACKRKSKKQKARCGPKQKKHQAKKHQAKKASKSGRGK